MESSAPDRGVTTLLIVEDDRRIRRAMRLLFATLPDSVRVVAASADIALRQAAELEPGVALVDVSLPQGVAGLNVLGTLADAGWSAVALSAQGWLRTTALAHGADAFVDTGVDPDEIVRLVRRLLAHPTARQEKRCERRC